MIMKNSVEQALDNKANDILEKEIHEVCSFMVNNKLLRHIIIKIWESEEKSLYWSRWIFELGMYDTGSIRDWNSEKYREKRKAEIIKDILNDFSKSEEVVIDKPKEADKDIILNFLEENICIYSKKIVSTISAIEHWHIQSTWNEIEIYEKIVTALAFIKSNYIKTYDGIMM